MILAEDNVGFLLTTGSNHSVNLANLDRVNLLHGLLDHGLGCKFVNNEDKSVVVFNCLDGTFGASWVLNDCILVPGVLNFNAVGNSLSLARECKSLGASESDFVPCLGLLSGMSAFLDLICSGFGLNSKM